MLEDLCFLYECAPFKEIDPTKFRGLFRSQFVVGALYHHYNTTKYAISVPGLYNKDDKPVGAIGLAAVAMERAFHLFEKQQISVDPTDGSLNIGKTENRRTRRHASYAKSAAGLGPDAIKKLIDKIHEPIVISSSKEEDECRAILVDYTMD
ncbi:hypothetical protein A0H81_14150 [Grifola frondosa]|uniref:Uncharacterized protein n=1 Tax=Grifola frondosa TaxID=5627 RepID=A0A1C7LMQ5_GRIFR|nr:hypothetical protein A0H81_14150 [Grifola frondosa]